MCKRPLSMILVLCLACSGLFGCASKYGEQTTNVVLHHDCYEPIQRLRDEEYRVAKTTAGVAVAGGLLGALVGALRGGTKGAVAGAAAGVALGGAGGYFYAVQEQSKDENARMAHYMRDLNGDISGLNIATASARMAIQCYTQKFDSGLAQYKKQTITREQFEASYIEIKSGVDEAQRILGTVIISAQENDAKYKAAISEEEKLQPTSVAVAPKPGKTQAKKQPAPGALNEVKAKQASYKASIADAEKTQKEADEFRKRMDAHMS